MAKAREPDFSFLNDPKKVEHAVEQVGTAIAEVVGQRLDKRVDEAVEAAVARLMNDGIDTFVALSLEHTVNRAFDRYFKPIADSWKRDEDAADWWKRSSEDEDDDE